MKTVRKKSLFYFLLLTLIMNCLINNNVNALDPQPEPPAPQIEVLIDNSRLTLDVAPIIEKGRTLVPMRAIFEALKATVDWNSAEQRITAKKGNLTVYLKIGSTTAWLERSSVPLNADTQVFSKTEQQSSTERLALDVAPSIVKGRTLVPARFVSEILGAKVNWNASSRRVEITTSTTASSAAPSASSDAPDSTPVPQPTGNIKLQDNELSMVGEGFDLSMINGTKYIKKKFDKSILDSISASSKLDFTPYITMTTNQDGWGGCVGRSIIHCTNILKEREHPYTPDVSFRYLQYYNDKAFKEFEAAHPNEDYPPITANLLKERGLCSEGSCPTNYDGALVKYAVDDNGKSYYYHDLSPIPAPSTQNDAEAGLYKVNFYGSDYSIDNEGVEFAKKLMQNYGPIIGCGLTTKRDHAVSIVAYDDNYDNGSGKNPGAFTVLNSWGDTWNGNGYIMIPYDSFKSTFDHFMLLENIPSDRALSASAYSARINLHHNFMRRFLTIKIGVEGKEPITIWNQPNSQVNKCPDNSKDICIDVKLPDYASSCWPPSQSNSWYVEVTNNSNLDPYDTDEWNDKYCSALLKEITFAKLSKDSSGKFSTEKYSYEKKDIMIRGEETIKFYMPSRIGYNVTLQSDKQSMLSGGTVKLSGKVSNAVEYSDSLRVPKTITGGSLTGNTRIAIYGYIKTGDGKSSDGTWQTLGSATVASDGTFAYSSTLSKSCTFMAAYIDNEYQEVLAASNNVPVTVGNVNPELTKQLPKLPDLHFASPAPTPAASIVIPSARITPSIPDLKTPEVSARIIPSIPNLNTPAPSARIIPSIPDLNTPAPSVVTTPSPSSIIHTISPSQITRVSPIPVISPVPSINIRPKR